MPWILEYLFLHYTITSECDVSLFLPIFPYDDFKCAPVLVFVQHSYGPCFVSRALVQQQDQSLGQPQVRTDS